MRQNALKIVSWYRNHLLHTKTKHIKTFFPPFFEVTSQICPTRNSTKIHDRPNPNLILPLGSTAPTTMAGTGLPTGHHRRYRPPHRPPSTVPASPPATVDGGRYRRRWVLEIGQGYHNLIRMMNTMFPYEMNDRIKSLENKYKFSCVYAMFRSIGYKGSGNRTWNNI